MKLSKLWWWYGSGEVTPSEESTLLMEDSGDILMEDSGNILTE
jgi:hypothetical protein